MAAMCGRDPGEMGNGRAEGPSGGPPEFKPDIMGVHYHRERGTLTRHKVAHSTFALRYVFSLAKCLFISTQSRARP